MPADDLRNPQTVESQKHNPTLLRKTSLSPQTENYWKIPLDHRVIIHEQETNIVRQLPCSSPKVDARRALAIY